MTTQQCIESCPPERPIDFYGACVDISGVDCPGDRPKWTDTGCVEASECAAHQYWVQDDYPNPSGCTNCHGSVPKVVDNVCTACPGDTPKWDPDTEQCVAVHDIYDSSECSNNQKWVQDDLLNPTGCTSCLGRFPKLNNNVCTACPATRPRWDGSECREASCAPYQRWVQDSLTNPSGCTNCPLHAPRVIDNKCTACPVDTPHFANGQCHPIDCPEGTVSVQDSFDSYSCTPCPFSALKIVDNKCTSCYGQTPKWNGTACEKHGCPRSKPRFEQTSLTSGECHACEENTYYHRNTNTCENVPPFIYLDAGAIAFPMDRFKQGEFDTLDVGVVGVPVFEDVDEDGDEDLIVGSDGGDIYYYEKKPPSDFNSDPYFEYAGKVADQDTPFVIDPGVGPERENPALAFEDLDGDGLRDLVVGFYGIGTDETVGLNIYAFKKSLENAGYKYRPWDYNMFEGIYVGAIAAPTFVDMDGDNVNEMVVGKKHGELMCFKKQVDDDGTISYEEQIGVDNPFDGFYYEDVNIYPSMLPTHAYLHPVFADIDDDGKLDLVVGARYHIFIHLALPSLPSSPLQLRYSKSPHYIVDLSKYDSTAPVETMRRIKPVKNHITGFDSDNTLKMVIGTYSGKVEDLELYFSECDFPYTRFAGSFTCDMCPAEKPKINSVGECVACPADKFHDWMFNTCVYYREAQSAQSCDIDDYKDAELLSELASRREDSQC